MSKGQSGALFSTNDVHSGAFIVYINGLEVPCKSVSHRYGVWQVPEMVLEMVADPVLTRLGAEDRVQVQVFYLDDTKVDPSVAPQFRIFGEGEITGWGYQNTPSGRSIMLTCVNQVAIFSQLFVHFLTNLDDMMGHDTFKGAGADGVAVATSDIVFPFSLFSQGIIPGESPDNPTSSSITRPFDFLYNVVKNMIGAQVPNEHHAVPATNFFTRWARLTNFHNRFAAMPFFDEVTDGNIFPVLKALQNTSAVDVLSKNLIPQVQNAGSLWDMLQLVYQTVFMEVTMIPTMPLVSVDLKSGHIQQTNFEKHKLTLVDGRYVPATSPDPLKPHRIPNYFAKPQFLFGLPPTCNVIFPSQLKMFAYDENFATQPTRLYFNDETISKILKIQQGGYGETVLNSLATAYPPEADAANQARRLFPKFNGKNFLLFPEEFFKGPVMDRRNIPQWLFFLKQSENLQSPTTSDGTVDVPPPPAQTGASTVKTPLIVPANAMRTDARIGAVGVDGKRVFSNNVEALRADITRLTMGNSITIDFALAWIQHVSDGNLKATSASNERGYFQVAGPHIKGDGTLVKFTDSEAAAIGLTEAHTGSGADSPLPGETPPLLSTNHEESLRAGIALILYHRRQADRLANKHALGWSEGDMWRLTKLFDSDSSYATEFVEKAVAANVATDWTSAVNGVASSLDSRPQAAVNVATGVGGVVPTASGTTVDSNQQVIKQAAASPPPTTPSDITSSTSGNASAGAAAGTPSQADLFEQAREGQQTVYQLYAKYEFFRERYSRRTGSAVIAFNPYVVPGFPATIFDRRDTRVDVFCYVTTVQQKLSHRGARETTLSFVYGRTIQEMFDLMRHEFSLGGAAAGTGPREPIRDIRKVVQSFSSAETLYQRLFYGNQVLFGKDASFDYRKVIGYQPEVPSDMPERIVIEGPDEASQDAAERAKADIATLEGVKQTLEQQIAVFTQSQRDAQIALRELRNPTETLSAAQESIRANAQSQFDVASHGVHTAKAQLTAIDASINYQMSVLVSSNETNAQTHVVHNLAGDREIVPLPAAEGAFQDYDVAMRYNWRPICTLDEYILFYDSVGEGPVPASNHPRSAGAVYYDRIRRMTPVTADFQFPPGADGLSSAVVTATPEQVAAGEAPAHAASVPGLKSGTGPNGTNAPGDFPQVRDDWDKILLAYRNNVYHVKAPRT
jgi:hypothetical protein